MPTGAVVAHHGPPSVITTWIGVLSICFTAGFILLLVSLLGYYCYKRQSRTAKQQLPFEEQSELEAALLMTDTEIYY